MRKFPGAVLVLSLAALPLAGCDTLGLGSPDHNVSVSFSVPNVSAGGGGAASVVAADTISDGTHRIDLQEVDLVLNKVVLERARGGDMNDDDDSDHDGRFDHKLRAGAITIELPLAGGVITPIAAPLPDGLYEEVKLDIAFVRAQGTFDGQAFDITVPINKKLEMDIDPPFEVDSEDDVFNVTITINLRSWFLSSSGVLLDPRAAQLNQSVQQTLANRIRASFRAFEDEDRDADDRDTDTDTDKRHGHGNRGHR